VRWFWLLVIGTVGCGRLGFEPIASSGHDADTSIPHDEDDDGVGDLLDGCPHVADPGQADGDDDGVGDACDPNPTASGDRIALFDPFTGPRAEWTFTGPQPVFSGDSLILDTTGDAMFIAALPASAGSKDIYAYAGSVTATGPGQQMLVLGLGVAPLFAPSSTREYYCEVCGGGPCGPSTFFSFTFTFDNSIFTQNKVTAQPFDVGPFSLRLEQAPPAITCATSLPADQQIVNDSLPGIAPTGMALGVRNLVVSIDYFVQIHTD